MQSPPCEAARSSSSSISFSTRNDAEGCSPLNIWVLVEQYFFLLTHRRLVIETTFRKSTLLPSSDVETNVPGGPHVRSCSHLLAL